MAVLTPPRKAQASPRAPVPVPPDRQFSFTDFQVNNPSAPPPGDRLDGEYDRTNAVVEETIAWASVSLNSDGTIRPGAIGKTQVEPDLFNFVALDAEDRVRPLSQDALASAQLALSAAAEADASALAAAGQQELAEDAAQRAEAAQQDAAADAANAAQSALEAAASAVAAEDSANHAAGDAAVCEDYGVLTQAWAEHMPDTIPPNILAVMGVTGDHWSSRWWANRAAEIVEGSDGGGTAEVILSDTMPVNPPPQNGQLWWDSSTNPGGGQLYVYFDDGTSEQWVPATNQPGPAGPQGPAGSTGPAGPAGAPGHTTVSATAPSSPVQGDLWFDTVGGGLMIWYDDGTSAQWIEATASTMAAAKYVMGFSFVGGVLGATQLLGLHRVSKAIRFPANFGTYAGYASEAGATANATASTILAVAKALVATPTTFASVGTITFAAGTITPTFATSGGAAVDFAQGDIARLTGPATADATLANVYVTLVAQEL